ncbi:MAG TPA: TIGR02186 family protein, partial [Thermodesulfobacteriota bacterium]|nr:TIGR02186 family protein [Thermodesulfobacteriota bacterium]
VTIQQAVRNHTVDLILAVLLFVGSTVGAQIGARVSHRLRGEQIRILLAIIVLLVMAKMLWGLLAGPGDPVRLVHRIEGQASGAAAWLFHHAHHNAGWYGVFATAVAAASGLLVGIVFKRARTGQQ